MLLELALIYFLGELKLFDGVNYIKCGERSGVYDKRKADLVDFLYWPW